MIPPHSGSFKTSGFVVFFEIVNKYIATLKAAMHCSYPIFKTPDLCLVDESVDSLMFKLYILNDNNRVCYRKYLFNPEIQFWLVDF